MSSSRSIEDQITAAANKITRELSSYFEKTVCKTCAKVKQADEQWMTETLSALTEDFKQNCMQGFKQVLATYKVNDKQEALCAANKTLRPKGAWQPNGDPEHDVCPQLHVVKEQYKDELYNQVLDLNRQLKDQLKELNARERKALDEHTKMQLILKKVNVMLTLSQEANEEPLTNLADPPTPS